MLYSKLQLPILNEYRENVIFLLGKKQQQHEIYISAKPDYVLGEKVEHYFDYLEYFSKNPLNTFADASRDLNVHPTTVSRNLKKLQSLFSFRVASVSNRWVFGLRTYILFFDLNLNNDMHQIQRTMESYPFFNIFSKSLNNGHHYIGFILPADDDIACGFNESITRFSRLNFKSWRLHELLGVEANIWTKNFTKNGWLIPKIILDNRFPPSLGDNFNPQSHKSENDPQLTARDFIVFSLLPSNLRRPVNELVKFACAVENNITEREAYYRKIKLLGKRVVIPWPIWNDNYGYDLQLEVICNKEMSHVLISAAKETTVFYSGLTSEGVILYLTIPLSHLNIYKKYFIWLLDELGISDFRFTLRKYAPSGGFYLDTVKNWNYGPKGFTVEGLDISADIFDYIE